MKLNNKTNFGVGLAIILGSFYFFYVSEKFPREISHIPGPALFPQIILGLFVILGGLTIYSAFKSPNERRPDEASQITKERQPVRNVFIFVIYILLYGLSVWGGLFIYMTPIFIFIATWTLLKFVAKPIPYGQLMIISVVLSAALYVAFVRILKVPLQ